MRLVLFRRLGGCLEDGGEAFGVGQASVGEVECQRREGHAGQGCSGVLDGLEMQGDGVELVEHMGRAHQKTL